MLSCLPLGMNNTGNIIEGTCCYCSAVSAYKCEAFVSLLILCVINRHSLFLSYSGLKFKRENVPVVLFIRIPACFPMARPSTATRGRNPATSSSIRGTSSSCGAKWMNSGTMASCTAHRASSQPAISSASSPCHTPRPREKHFMISR